MQIRRYVAADMREALEQVKADLGPEAVILSTREVREGPLSRRALEVTAAMEAEPPPPPAPERAWSEDLQTELRALRQEMRSLGVGAAEIDAWEVRKLRSEVGALRIAMRDAQGSLRVAAAARGDVCAAMAPEQASLCARLLAQGVEDVVAEDLVRTAGLRVPARELEAELRRMVEKTVRCAPPLWERRGARVAVFVGPTGVGKTTTLAKVAARAVARRRRVALLTVDTYRIGAFEQLARYGEILDVPAAVAKDARELRTHLSRFKDRDLVLVDTGGRSPRDERALEEAAERLRGAGEAEVHLTLAAATPPPELAATLQCYESFRPTHIDFTKLDETERPGALLNAAARAEAQFSFLCAGQRVPEDIEPARAPDVAERVLAEP
jgi:flagellar biosynthesis protein FlhF